MKMARLQNSRAGIKQSATWDSWTAVIEDIKGNTTSKQVKGGGPNITLNVQISQSGWRGHIYTFCAIFWAPA